MTPLYMQDAVDNMQFTKITLYASFEFQKANR